MSKQGDESRLVCTHPEHSTHPKAPNLAKACKCLLRQLFDKGIHRALEEDARDAANLRVGLDQ